MRMQDGDEFSEALPCPFCEARPRVGRYMHLIDAEANFVLYCYGENHSSEAKGDTPEECVKNWNCR